MEIVLKIRIKETAYTRDLEGSCALCRTYRPVKVYHAFLSTEKKPIVILVCRKCFGELAHERIK